MISGIMGDLDHAGVSLLTPFPGFCLFSAATTNMYASAFPWMVPKHNAANSAIIENDLGLLKKFQKIWRIGECWWSTINRCKALYVQANSNPHTLRGQTRSHYHSLDSAIHDCSGRSSEYERMDHEGCITSDPNQDVPSRWDEHDQVTTGDLRMEQDALLDTDLDWSQLWPLFGVQDDIFPPA
jgi:hypothetical protein